MQAAFKGARLMFIFLWTLMVAIGSARAAQSTVPSTGTFSGSFVSTDSDTNGDGLKGGLFTGAGEDSVGGTFTAQSVTEQVVAGETLCPNGNLGVELTLVPGSGHFVNREAGGELLYGEYIAQAQCYDAATKTIFYTYTNRFTGGMGRFEGVTGTSEGQGIVTVLFQDAAGNVFGASSGEYTTTLILSTAE